jgi:hypothetical protein
VPSSTNLSQPDAAVLRHVPSPIAAHKSLATMNRANLQTEAWQAQVNWRVVTSHRRTSALESGWQRLHCLFYLGTDSKRLSKHVCPEALSFHLLHPFSCVFDTLAARFSPDLRHCTFHPSSHDTSSAKVQVRALAEHIPHVFSVVPDAILYKSAPFRCVRLVCERAAYADNSLLLPCIKQISIHIVLIWSIESIKEQGRTHLGA